MGAERIGGDGHDMQATIQHRWSNALIGRQTTHEVAFQDEEAMGAIGIFPGYSVDVVVGSDEQQTLRCRVKSALCRCSRWEEGLVGSLTVGDRVVKSLWRSLVAVRDKCP